MMTVKVIQKTFVSWSRIAVASVGSNPAVLVACVDHDFAVASYIWTDAGFEASPFMT